MFFKKIMKAPSILKNHFNKQAEPEIINKKTSLGRACQAGDLKLVERLLKAGANPNEHDYYDKLPLHYTIDKYISSDKDNIDNYAEEIMKLLLENGANPNLICYDTPSPLDYAWRKCTKKSREAEAIMLDHVFYSIHGTTRPLFS